MSIIKANQLQSEKDIHLLHGAAIEWQRRAYVFLAPTTSGKTTLASYLTSNGFGYITDDCILLDKTNFYIHPNTTPIHLRNGGLDILKQYNAEPMHVKHINERYVYTPNNCITDALPISKIYFIKRTENENKVVQMNTITRITELMKSPIQEYQVTSEYIKFISHLAKFDCQYLLYSDMNYVAEVIKNG